MSSHHRRACHRPRRCVAYRGKQTGWRSSFRYYDANKVTITWKKPDGSVIVLSPAAFSSFKFVKR
jgi:hypothetical protein